MATTPNSKTPTSDPTELAKVKPTAAPLVAMRPAFIDEQPVQGVEDLGKYVQYPRLKIIQKQAGREILEQFRVGAIVQMPEGIVLANIGASASGVSVEKGDPVNFIPIAFFEQWCTWGDIADRGKGSPILETTTDPNHPIAIKARNKDTREEIIGTGATKKKIRHVEHLCFFIRIFMPGHAADGNLIMMTFQRGSHRDGRNLAKLIKMRKASPYYCVFQMQAARREADGNDWYVPEIDNPSGDVNPWVTDAAFGAQMKELHESAMTLVKANKLVVAHDTDDDEVAVDLEGSAV